MKACCRDCKYSMNSKQDDERLECHRYPPQSIPDFNDDYVGWPPISGLDICGEYRKERNIKNA